MRRWTPTILVFLGHDISDVVLGALAEHAPEALSALLAFGAQAHHRVILGLFAMTDHVDDGVACCNRGDEEQN